MKTTIFILLGIILYGFSYGQQTIYVTSTTDKRLVAYKDSLTRWYNNEQNKKKYIELFDAAPNLSVYIEVGERLGFFDTELPTTNDKMLMYDSPQKKHISSELLTCFHSIIGDVACAYIAIVPKPTRKVVYIKPKPIIRPEPIPVVAYKKTIYININAHMDTTKNAMIIDVIPNAEIKR